MRKQRASNHARKGRPMTNYSGHFAAKAGITRRSFTALFLALALGISLIAAPDSFAGAPERWVPTWATSPASAPTTIAFENQTLREIVHISLGGSRVRVRFSNTLGTETLWIMQHMWRCAPRNRR